MRWQAAAETRDAGRREKLHEAVADPWTQARPAGCSRGRKLYRCSPCGPRAASETRRQSSRCVRCAGQQDHAAPGEGLTHRKMATSAEVFEVWWLLMMLTREGQDAPRCHKEARQERSRDGVARCYVFLWTRRPSAHFR